MLRSSSSFLLSYLSQEEKIHYVAKLFVVIEAKEPLEEDLDNVVVVLELSLQLDILEGNLMVLILDEKTSRSRVFLSISSFFSFLMAVIASTIFGSLDLLF